MHLNDLPETHLERRQQELAEIAEMVVSQELKMRITEGIAHISLTLTIRRQHRLREINQQGDYYQ